ncbi:LPS export ABC transporter periplasmic protein LptC [Candidatus Synechococcus spongiarum]|uniref:Uncharacterized protein n=1 Tax=Candidatus Synechococcus spongiarum TaxID=431041 RepID=A0A164Y544_9SYNE|nr:LPS export ABC transporter periplasmic protein LptC [Candidatus Synechococcus spongiarum]SAY39145.1 hypothetical protein FLM9_1209 [Candidatus Synechococcus spongiarum]
MISEERPAPSGSAATGLLFAAPYSAVLLAVLLAGCTLPTLETALQEQAPHELQSFSLQHHSSDTPLSLSLTSPKARHDWIRKTSVVTTPEAVIHRDGVPVYGIRAQRGLLLGNNRLVQLDGAVEVVHLQEPSTVVTSERLRWDTHRGRMTMTINLTVKREHVQASAGRAELDFASEDLSFHDQVVVLDQSPQADDLRLEATTLHWNLASGDLMAPGPVKAGQTAPGGAVQSAQGFDLTGNSQQRWLELQAPVQLQTRQAGQWQAQDSVLWRLDRQQLDSPGLLEAQAGALQVSGRSAMLDLKQGVLTIGESCRFHQPGETLTAQQCRWNWQDRTILARGGVTLQREQYQQITRADQLQGRLGEDNILSLTAPPQGHVTTELELGLEPSG